MHHIYTFRQIKLFCKPSSKLLFVLAVLAMGSISSYNVLMLAFALPHCSSARDAAWMQCSLLQNVLQIFNNSWGVKFQNIFLLKSKLLIYCLRCWRNKCSVTKLRKLSASEVECMGIVLITQCFEFSYICCAKKLEYEIHFQAVSRCKKIELWTGSINRFTRRLEESTDDYSSFTAPKWRTGRMKWKYFSAVDCNFQLCLTSLAPNKLKVLHVVMRGSLLTCPEFQAPNTIMGEWCYYSNCVFVVF